MVLGGGDEQGARASLGQRARTVDRAVEDGRARLIEGQVAVVADGAEDITGGAAVANLKRAGGDRSTTGVIVAVDQSQFAAPALDDRTEAGDGTAGERIVAGGIHGNLGRRHGGGNVNVRLGDAGIIEEDGIRLIELVSHTGVQPVGIGVDVPVGAGTTIPHEGGIGAGEGDLNVIGVGLNDRGGVARETGRGNHQMAGTGEQVADHGVRSAGVGRAPEEVEDHRCGGIERQRALREDQIIGGGGGGGINDERGPCIHRDVAGGQRADGQGGAAGEAGARLHNDRADGDTIALQRARRDCGGIGKGVGGIQGKVTRALLDQATTTGQHATERDDAVGTVEGGRAIGEAHGHGRRPACGSIGGGLQGADGTATQNDRGRVATDTA